MPVTTVPDSAALLLHATGRAAQQSKVRFVLFFFLLLIIPRPSVAC